MCYHFLLGADMYTCKYVSSTEAGVGRIRKKGDLHPLIIDHRPGCPEITRGGISGASGSA